MLPVLDRTKKRERKKETLSQKKRTKTTEKKVTTAAAVLRTKEQRRQPASVCERGRECENECWRTVLVEEEKKQLSQHGQLRERHRQIEEGEGVFKDARDVFSVSEQTAGVWLLFGCPFTLFSFPSNRFLAVDLSVFGETREMRGRFFRASD